ncbi:MAG TPA: hypothetical protein DEP87_00325 [Candidatus Pacebacteria bacterium]|nr:hypothetical protein [Candidatus Paceibacterota bacterium]
MGGLDQFWQKQLVSIMGFDWNEANQTKNYFKHAVSWQEVEEIFANQPLLILPDQQHSKNEIRYYALGRTNQNKQLLIVFTIRQNLIRVISARNQNKKERQTYAKI